MNPKFQLKNLINHYHRFFEGHDCSEWTWDRGPIGQVAPWFKVLRFAPGPKIGLWTYASVGASLLSPPGSKKIEFVIMTDEATPQAVEHLAMIAHYHFKEHLNYFHSLPIGQPWLDGATCDHFLISIPYPFGEDLEVCSLGNEHIQILWLLPITKAEYDFKKINGVEALEEKFEQAGIEYWKLDRQSVV